MKIYIVKWGDAWAAHGYYDSSNSYAPAVMHDIGWLVEENDETIVLCRSRYKDNDANRSLTVIPWVNVISIEELVG